MVTHADCFALLSCSIENNWLEHCQHYLWSNHEHVTDLWCLASFCKFSKVWGQDDSRWFFWSKLRVGVTYVWLKSSRVGKQKGWKLTFPWYWGRQGPQNPERIWGSGLGWWYGYLTDKEEQGHGWPYVYSKTLNSILNLTVSEWSFWIVGDDLVDWSSSGNVTGGEILDQLNLELGDILKAIKSILLNLWSIFP